MSDVTGRPVGDTGVDIGAFCRQVEDHLARLNDGHLIRIVGPGFELVRGWALEGIPLSLVFHGIDLKAERHKAGRSTRPLRLEFCEADVREVYTRWRRAVGLGGHVAAVEATGDDAAASGEGRRRPSLTRHLDRVVDRLSRIVGRLDLPDAFREALDGAMQQVVALRDEVKGSRGPVRDALVDRLPAIDNALMVAARLAVGVEHLERIRAEAAGELGAYRERLGPEAWRRSVDLTADRLVRSHLGLPTLEIEP